MSKTSQKHIIQVALPLFSSLGYSGTSIRKIASEAGIRESAVYNHFTSKKDIFQECVKFAKNQFNDSEIFTDKLLDELSNPKQFLLKATKALFQKWSETESIQILRFVILSQDTAENIPPVSISDLLGESKKIWVLIFAEMIKHKFVKKFDPYILAVEFFEPLFSTRLQFSLNEPETKKIDQFVEDHINYFWTSIKK